MRDRSTSLIAVLVAVLAFPLMTFAQTVMEQSGTTKARAAAPALSHDLSGVWTQYPEGNVPGVPGMNAINDKSRPPLTPWGQTRLDAASPNVGPRAVAGKESAPPLRCEPAGVPMILVLPNPFEIAQVPGRVLMFFEEYHVWRTIWTDGRTLPKSPAPTWLGYSVGKWEGDTFVVDTTGFNDRSWVDPFGDPHSEQMHVTERYRRLDHDTLELAITINDPKAYTKTWINPPKLHKLEPAWELAEWFCIRDDLNAYDKTVRKPAGDAPSPQ